MKQVFSQILAFNNQLEEAYKICDDLFKKYLTNIFAQVHQCYKFDLQGNKEKALQAMLYGVNEKARTNKIYNAYVMAECDALIGEKDEAITSPECAVKLGAVNYPWYNETVPCLKTSAVRSDSKCSWKESSTNGRPSKYREPSIDLYYMGWLRQITYCIHHTACHTICRLAPLIWRSSQMGK